VDRGAQVELKRERVSAPATRSMVATKMADSFMVGFFFTSLSSSSLFARRYTRSLAHSSCWMVSRQEGRTGSNFLYF